MTRYDLIELVITETCSAFGIKWAVLYDSVMMYTPRVAVARQTVSYTLSIFHSYDLAIIALYPLARSVEENRQARGFISMYNKNTRLEMKNDEHYKSIVWLILETVNKHNKTIKDIKAA